MLNEFTTKSYHLTRLPFLPGCVLHLQALGVCSRHRKQAAPRSLTQQLQPPQQQQQQPQQQWHSLPQDQETEEEEEEEEEEDVEI